MKIKIPHKLGRPLLRLSKASPQLMFVGGVAGVVTAGVLACRSTLKLSETFEEHEKLVHQINELKEAQGDQYEEYTRDLAVAKAKAVIAVAKLYAPAIGVAVLSIGLLTGSHVVLNKRNASLSAAYMAVQESYNQYRDRVRQELGQDGDDRFRHGTQTISETVKGDDGKNKTIKHVRVADGAPSMYAKFFDELCDNWKDNPEYNAIFLRAQQNYANDLLQARGHVLLNDVYDMLGIPRTGAGCVVGWLWGKGGDDYIDFGVFDDATNERVRDFVNGREHSILLDFNVDGPINHLL
jgi:Family of unknown function (DUF6353)